MGRAENGELLKLAAKHFEVFLTIDRNLEYQQNFTGLTLAVIVVHAPSNDVAVLQPLWRLAYTSSARRPLSNCVGLGGQPRMCRSTGTTADTPPTTA